VLPRLLQLLTVLGAGLEVAAEEEEGSLLRKGVGELEGGGGQVFSFRKPEILPLR